MVLSQQNETTPANARPLEAILADVEALTRELIDVAGPAALEASDLGSLSGIGSRLTAASPQLRTVCTQLDVLRMTWLRRIERDGMWALDGSRTFRTWLARQEKITMRTASREVLTGERLLECLPATLAAVLDGRMSMDQMRVMVDVGPTSQERRKALLTPIDLPQGGTAGSPEDDHPASDSTDGSTDDSTDDMADDGSGDGETSSSPAEDSADGRTKVPTGEEVLLGLAGQHGPMVFRRFVDRFARVTDPESDERGYKEASEREHLEVAKTFGGYHVDGFLTDEHGEALRAAMDSVLGTPTPGEDRTPTQRRAQALADLARTVLDNGVTGAGAAVRPHLSVTVSWTELTRLTSGSHAPACDHPADAPDGNHAGENTNDPDDRYHGHVGEHRTGQDTGDGGNTRGNTRDATLFDPPGNLTAITAAPARFGISAALVPPATLRRLLCDCAVTRVVFGPNSQVLDVGRAQRTVTGQMRRAVIARDQHCVYPDCAQPPSRCEVHHAERHWADGGETSVRNSALLCWHHHQLVDTTDITMRWTGNPNGTRHSGWTLTDRHGHDITPAGTTPRTNGRAA